VNLDPLRFRMTSAHVAGSAYVLALAGEVDLAQAAELDAELASLLTEGARHVIVDLLEVPFLESSALSVLIRCSKLLRAKDGDLTLVTDDARITRVIEITGLWSHFRFERTLSDAIDGASEAPHPPRATFSA
jgi:anti-sigma B factor antagonist